MNWLFLAAGVVGLIAIIISVLVKNEKRQDVGFILGGLLLLAYSYYRRDTIFMVLQVVFIAVALLELIKLSRRPSLWQRVKNWLK